jgi:tetratricopeptide (TPR) repeat protein
MADTGDLDDLHSCTVGGEEKLNAEGEIAVARLAMDGGDLPHAATHVGNALADAPQLPEAHEALAELAAHAGGPEAALALYPMERPYIGAATARAHLLAAAARWDEAVRLLAEIIRTEPGRHWSHVAWLSRADLGRLVTPEAAAHAISRIVGSGLPDPFPEVLRTSLRPFYAAVRTVLAGHSGHPLLLSMTSGLARRYGDHEDAIAWARSAAELDPSHMSAVMLGYALRAAGRADEAITVWERELSRDPSDLSLHVDVAELYAATGRPELGLPWAERAVAADPDDPLVVPALLGIRFSVDGEQAHLLALADHLREHPEHSYAAAVLERHSDGLPWLSRVGGAREATINAMHQFLESPDSKSHHEIEMVTSGVEAPSAVVTLLQSFPNAQVSFQSVPEPDPREPLCPVRTRVWRYEGFVARPAVAAPSAQAQSAVQAVAEVRWPTLPAAYDHAVRLAVLPIDELLGVLVHPPKPREDEQGRYLAAHLPELWIRAVQVFACLGIAHHGTDAPWPESERRQILHDLLMGPEDWVTEAAGTALLAIAWSDPSTREDIGRLLVERMLAACEAYRSRPVEVLPTLCALVRSCPWLDDRFRSLAADFLEIVRRDDELPEPPEAAELRTGLADAAREASEARTATDEKPVRRGLFRRRRR